MFSPLAAHCGAVNLGQGFPNFQAPAFVKQAACNAINGDLANQYAPPKGMPRLRKQLAASYGPLMGRALDADTEVVVTAGANEGMFIHGIWIR